MAEGRMLKRVISESKKLGKLKSDSARLLYTWLIPWLDVEGRHSADIEIIKGHIFPKVKSMKIEKIKRLLLELAEIGLIILYRNSNEDFLQLNKFFDHQKIRKDREGETKIPAPNDENSEVIKGYSGVNQEYATTSKVKGSKVNGSLSKYIVPQIITYLNKKAKTKYLPTTQITIDYISGRIADGFELKDFIHVIDVKCQEWVSTEYEKFLRPETLFCKKHFESYLNQKDESKKLSWAERMEIKEKEEKKDGYENI